MDCMNKSAITVTHVLQASPSKHAFCNARHNVCLPVVAGQQHWAALPWLAVQPWPAPVPDAALQGLFQTFPWCCRVVLALEQSPGLQAATGPAAAWLGAPSPRSSSTGCLLDRSLELDLCMQHDTDHVLSVVLFVPGGR